MRTPLKGGELIRRCLLLVVAVSFFAFLWASHLKPGSWQVRAQGLGNGDCLACHSDPALAKEAGGKSVSLHVREKDFAASVHGSLDCISCHADVKAVPHEPAPARVSCAECHSATHNAYNQGLHAKAIRDGSAKAASCLDCHGPPHSILPSSDPASKTFRTNVPTTCGSCHGQKFVMEGTGRSAQTFFSYQESVHGKAVAAGSTRAAVCTDCHKSHDIKPPSDAQSAIFKFNVPKTCGQCHEPVQHEFDQSIHGQAIARGNWQAPVCTDCHGIHFIKPHIDPTSSVASQAVARTTCAQCHEGVKLSQEFGVAGKRVSSYLDSYHGLASKLGSQVVANCASCHGIHNILPSSDPRSTVSKTNLVATCGRCHPGASENFALSKVHLDVGVSKDLGSVVSGWVRTIYLWLIGIVIGFMLIHNGLVWRKKAAAIRRNGVRQLVRMTARQRLQHWLLLTSFAVLVLTGFALAYPDSWLGWSLGSSETIRRIGHRVAAVVMIGAAVYHVGYALLTKEGRQALKDFRPRWKDFVDLMQNLGYYLGRRSERPLFGRFGYPEKAEYWAVIWGTLVMAMTGLMVWFKVGVFGFLPRWTIDVALTIHFYEAILATLAIIVWHFYHVIFDPDVYPMNWAWLDGRVSEEHFRQEHELATEASLEAQPKEE
ncbi:MAG TPA: cytochrome b/b6 domain-containing protein [Blastocatellia bacterium]|nr:cytochrome b/b6 domain-containing protein [Blastocatellia bacterium]